MTSPEPSPVLSALWESLDEKWNDERIHESFLTACAEENNLAFAAKKYREQKDGDDASRHQLACQKLEAVTALALARMSTLKTPPKKSKKGVTIFAAFVSGGLILACIYLLTL